MNESSVFLFSGTLGARDFSSAVSGFCQVTAEDVSAFGQHRKFPPYARKPLVPRVVQWPQGIRNWSMEKFDEFSPQGV